MKAVHRNRKPWRGFYRESRGIRRICLLLLLAECGAFMSRTPAFQIRWEQTAGAFYRAADGPSVREEILGIRLRIRDGALELYREEAAEEIH